MSAAFASKPRNQRRHSDPQTPQRATLNGGYPQAEIFEIVMRLIEKATGRHIDDLLSVFLDDTFLENEA